MDQYLWSLVIFAVSMVASPGPANMILLVAGTRFGLRRSLPFVFGIIVSKQFIIWPIGLGILVFFEYHPETVGVIKGLSFLYIFWLAWKLSNFKISHRSPFINAPKFLHGLLVHPTNPKAWAMVSVSFTSYTDSSQNTLTTTFLVAIIFIIVQLVFHILWCFSGDRLKQRLEGTKSEIWFMRFLSLLMLASLLLLLL